MNAVEIFRKNSWCVTAKPFALKFRFPFKLALNTRSYTDIVIVTIESRNGKAYGEAALPPYLGATVSSVIDFIGKLDWHEVLNAEISSARQLIDAAMPENNAAKAAVDMALHDLHGQEKQSTIGEMYGVKMEKPVYSTYTIGISSEKELIEKLKQGKDFKIIKLKLGTANDLEIVKNFRKHFYL